MERPCFNTLVNSPSRTTLINEEDISEVTPPDRCYSPHHLSPSSLIPRHCEAKRVNSIVPF